MLIHLVNSNVAIITCRHLLFWRRTRIAYCFDGRQWCWEGGRAVDTATCRRIRTAINASSVSSLSTRLLGA